MKDAVCVVTTNDAVCAVVMKAEADTHEADAAANGTKLIAYAFPALEANEEDTLVKDDIAVLAVSDCVANCDWVE